MFSGGKTFKGCARFYFFLQENDAHFVGNKKVFQQQVGLASIFIFAVKGFVVFYFLFKNGTKYENYA